MFVNNKCFDTRPIKTEHRLVTLYAVADGQKLCVWLHKGIMESSNGDVFRLQFYI